MNGCNEIPETTTALCLGLFRDRCLLALYRVLSACLNMFEDKRTSPSVTTPATSCATSSVASGSCFGLLLLDLIQNLELTLNQLW